MPRFASITINSGSLTTSSPTPTISGTASGLVTVTLSIADTSGHVDFSGNTGVGGGQWSVPVYTPLPNGSYQVSLGTADNGNATSAIFATGTLVVNAPSATSTQALGSNSSNLASALAAVEAAATPAQSASVASALQALLRTFGY